EKENIGSTVVNIHTLDPIDEETIIREAGATGAVVTYEEHQAQGGLGRAVAEVLAKNNPLPIAMIGLQNRSGQSAIDVYHLPKEYKMDVRDIVAAVKKVISRKK